MTTQGVKVNLKGKLILRDKHDHGQASGRAERQLLISIFIVNENCLRSYS